MLQFSGEREKAEAEAEAEADEQELYDSWKDWDEHNPGCGDDWDDSEHGQQKNVWQRLGLRVYGSCVQEFPVKGNYIN